MDLNERLNNLLSRKFLTPLIAILILWVKDSFFVNIPLADFIQMLTILSGSYLGLEGVKDLVIAMKDVK